LKVSERGRQQISFNGGLSGIGGSFFGLEYSTNNLLGRGEILSLNMSAGNRQKYVQFSFTEPYVKNRPITAGFSLFGYTQKFFGEGTFLSQNLDAQQGLTGSQIDFLNVSEENLFTRTSYGGSIFASAPLSEFYRKRRFTQFSRVGASYQFSTSSVKDPAVNQGSTCGTGGNTSVADNPQFIPVIYCQPNIITSRGTLSFAYDTRNASVDPTSGRELSVQLALAGLGGDVRTYQPTISYTQFRPMRRKKSDHPEVFGFRIIAGTVGSFATTAKVNSSNSLAFVDGIPIFERYFLGDEFTIRGYNVRSITPLAPLDTFITTKDVVVAANATGTPDPITGLPANTTALGTFTGLSGSNSARIASSFTPIGADTQVLGNFEYRIPVVGNTVQLAAFADIGTAFNLRSNSDQFFQSNFLDDQPFLATVGSIPCPRSPVGVAAANLSAIAACNADTSLAVVGINTLNPGLVMRANRLATTAELDNAINLTGFDPLTGLPFGFQEVFLRGQAQTNTAVRLSQSLFSKFGDYRASLGMEVRVQVPVINVPFRLILAYNPKARKDQFINGFPFIFNEKKRVFRFSVGRTF
jgi:outer membrane protein insertion porin family